MMCNQTGAAMAVALAAIAAGAPAAAQTMFEGVPGLTHYGDADGWQVKKLDSDDVWYGQACILFKALTPGPNPVQTYYRFEADDPEVSLRFRVPQSHSVPDPDAIDWGRLTPATFQYAVSESGPIARTHTIFEAEGHIGHDYVDATTIYIELSLDVDAAVVDRMAAGEQIGVAVKGTEGTTFVTGRATRGVALARRCLSSFR